MPKPREGGVSRPKRAKRTPSARSRSSTPQPKANGATPRAAGTLVCPIRMKPAAKTLAKRGSSSVSKAKTNGASHPAKGRPTIIPSQSVDHGTPPVVADGIIYPVFGDPVDLDPCSNHESIIRARRKVILPEDGLAIPWRGTVYVNPPYGKKIAEWIRKIVVENRNNGAQVIALLPGHTSSEWFDLVAATARACFFWGPGIGNRRLQFIGNKDGAAFHSVVAYWGSDLPLFTRHALRYCHAWYPEHDLRLAQALVGDVGRVPEGPAFSIAQADELLTLARNDDVASALASLGSATLGDILDAGDTILLGRLRQLCAYELGAALLYAARTNGKAWLDHRIPRTPKRLDPRQLDLLVGGEVPPVLPAAPDPAPDLSGAARSLDEIVYDEVRRGSAIGKLVTAQELKQRCACSQGQLRGALARLRKDEKIDKTGRTQGARYFATNGEEQAHV